MASLSFFLQPSAGVSHKPLLFSRPVVTRPSSHSVFPHPRDRRLVVCSLDAAQPYESHLSPRTAASSPPLKIAVVGFGNFGQFLAKALVRQGHTVLAYSRSDYSSIASDMQVRFFQDNHHLCEQHPDVVLLCTSIVSTETVLRSLPLQLLECNTLFVDVLSVKEFPKNLFLHVLPSEFDILCTHPMFGPQSGKVGWTGLPFVYDKVRIGCEEYKASRCDRFLDIFAKEGCEMVEMSCADHDMQAAKSQFITHTVGRILEKLGLERTLMNTKGYERLLELVDRSSKSCMCEFMFVLWFCKNLLKIY